MTAGAADERARIDEDVLDIMQAAEFIGDRGLRIVPDRAVQVS
jgi:hypothetical protein